MSPREQLPPHKLSSNIKTCALIAFWIWSNRQTDRQLSIEITVTQDEMEGGEMSGRGDRTRASV